MRNIRITLEYDGSAYAGWQIQKTHKDVCRSCRRVKPRIRKSIQGIIEKVLRQITGEEIRLFGSGRTDAGVHAKAQVANFKTNSKIPLDKLRLALNSLLPDTIVVTAADEVSPGFHSRFSAKSKIYRYTILNRAYPSAIIGKFVYFYPHKLSLKLMRSEAKALIGKHDFKSFKASEKKERSCVRTIKRLTIARHKHLIYIDIEANGFVYNMARNIVGTFIEAGRGRLPEGGIKAILDMRNRRLAGPTAPAKGLCLQRVNY